MKITITAKKMQIPQNFTEYAEKRLAAKLDRFFGEDADAKITMAEVKSEIVIELTVKYNNMIYRAEQSAADKEDALDASIDKIIRQIRRNKTRVEKRLKDTAFKDLAVAAAPDAEPEAAVEAAVLVEADLPPQAASAPAALIIPTAFKKERREMAFFIISSPYLSSYRRSFIPDRSCWPYYRKLLSFCPSVAYTIFRKFSCLFRTNIWDTSQVLATFTSFTASCSRFVIISA